MGFKNIFYLPLIVLIFGFDSIEKQKEVSNEEDNRSIISCNSIAENDIKNQPNIIFILADNQRFNNIYAIGNKEIIPPNFMLEHPFNNGELVIRDEWLAGFPRSAAEIKSNIKAYYAMITHMDSKIGHIIEALKEFGKYDNTVIVFAGDNGLALGQHGLMGKQNIYEHSIKVPLVFSGSGMPKNKRNNASVYLFDIYPTLMDMTNSETPKSVQGLSLKNLVDGTKKNT